MDAWLRASWSAAMDAYDPDAFSAQERRRLQAHFARLTPLG